MDVKLHQTIRQNVKKRWISPSSDPQSQKVSSFKPNNNPLILLNWALKVYLKTVCVSAFCSSASTSCDELRPNGRSAMATAWRAVATPSRLKTITQQPPGGIWSDRLRRHQTAAVFVPLINGSTRTLASVGRGHGLNMAAVQLAASVSAELS